ncbi:MAG: CDP-diacylglycerol--glycerol-3-phosphate 3-phosphatidyltransferase [Pseudomonadota bacterium]
MPSPDQTRKRSLNSAVFNIPNTLTFLRILAVPVLLILIHGHHTRRDEFWAAILFGSAFFTDLFDGWIARRTQSITRLGRVLDPVADKLIVVAALLLLIRLGRVDEVIAILLLSRELVVSGLRDIAGHEGILIASRASGKAKTMCEGFGLGFLLGGPGYALFGVSLMSAGTWLVYGALVLAYWSAFFYFRAYFKSEPSHPSA